MAPQPSAAPSGYVRELAEGGAGAAAGATSTEPRMLTEAEAYAVAAAEVKRETAAAQAKVTTLETEKAELQTKLDVAEVATATEKTAREKAEKDLADFKTEIENANTIAARSGDRTAKVREVAKHLADEFFTAERAARWAAMDDEAFEAYVAELAEVAPKGTGAGDGSGKDDKNKPPRETAASGSSVTPKGGADNLLALFPHAKVG